MKVTVDRSKCSGHAMCWSLDPDLFPIDDDGYSALQETEVPTDREAVARRGALSCPEGAITLVDEVSVA